MLFEHLLVFGCSLHICVGYTMYLNKVLQVVYSYAIEPEHKEKCKFPKCFHRTDDPLTKIKTAAGLGQRAFLFSARDSLL